MQVYCNFNECEYNDDGYCTRSIISIDETGLCQSNVIHESEEEDDEDE